MTKPASGISSFGSGPRTALAAAISVLLPFAASAGDILRGGATAGHRSGSVIPSSPNPAVVEQARVNGNDALARTTQTIQAMQAMQKSARELAQRGSGSLTRAGVPLPSVRDGLTQGGLKVAPGATPGSALWRGAAAPRQIQKNGGTNVIVTQTQQQALLTWETFNIGKKTTLTFDQGQGGKAVRQWVAINKVEDPAGVPSQILGKIEAPGQVYVINQNGILFGGTSQVNTHALVASALPINDNLVQRGLLNNPDAQFLFSALAIPALASNATMPAFTPPAAPNTPGGRLGDVIVEKGAQLTSPTSADGVGGRIALVGANVRNEGTIATPDGQTILAAGLQIGFTAHSASDPSLRGLDVYVGKVRAPTPAATPQDPTPAIPPLYAGTATNSGDIQAPRASVTIAGSSVEQLGVVESSTSVSLNGRIDLVASYNTTSPVVLNTARFTPGATGAVTLGPDSVTTILPELLSDATIANTKLPIASQVNIEGKTIHFGEDAQLLAPNANVTARAGAWLPLNGSTSFISSGGQIYLDAGASINVAGSRDVLAEMAQNIISLELRGAELADSPTQRDGVLRGVTLNVDLRKTGSFNGLSWAGTPLGNATGFLGLIERNVAQLSTAGGNVSLSAGQSVVLRQGSLVDVSGGWTNFAGGFVETTRVTSGARIYDISNATPDLQYRGIYQAESSKTFAKWGITETFAQPLGLSGRHWENSYTQGADAGAINITAPSVALDGTLRGLSVPGERQRETQPKPGALAISFTAQDASHPQYLTYSPTPPQVVFQSTSTLAEADDFSVRADGSPAPLRADRLGRVELSPALLTEQGFGSLTVSNPTGSIILPAGVSLSAAAEGTVSLSAANLNIAGHITAPGGSISLTAFNIAPGDYLRLKAQTNPVPQTPPPAAGRGLVSLAPGAVLSTAGLVVDERPGRSSGVNLPIALDGGTISLLGYDVSIPEGSTLDVSGGVQVDGLGAKHWGRAGSLSIKAGQDPNVLSVTGGSLELAGTLRGFAGDQHAGSLEIQAGTIQVGGTSTHPETLLLAPQFFSTGGFGSFTLTGLGAPVGTGGEVLPGVFVAPGTTLAPVAQSFLLVPHGGADGGLELQPFAKPLAGRSPVSFHLNAPGVLDAFSGARLIRGDIVLGEGAVLRADPLASISLKGNTVTVRGQIFAPAGDITIAGSTNSTSVFADQTQALSTVFLGPRAVLSAAGTTLLTPNAFGHRTGSVLAGGSISVTGNLVARAGSVLDVSGATDVLDFAPAYVRGVATVEPALSPATLAASRGLTMTPLGQTVVSQRVDSDAGSITLTGGQSLQSDATLLGLAGGPDALGGSLSVSSGRFYQPGGGEPTPLDVTLQVFQRGNFAAPATAGVGQAQPGVGQFAASRFSAGGFDSLALKGTVQFSGSVSIAARRELSVADAGVLYADSAVQLSAAYVKLGTPFLTPLTPAQQNPPFTSGGTAFNFGPTSGPGSLTVRATLIDVGTLSLQGITRAGFIADRGDIRGVGTLDIAGDLTLRAAQIYPPSALSFTITASEKNITVAQSTQGAKEVQLASAALPPGFGVGSPLLGSTVQSIDGKKVTLAAGADRSISAKTALVYAPGSGSVTIEGSGVRQLPLSAGGQLSIYGATIHQGGTLVAPLGGITLGWDGTGAAPKGAVTGQSVPFTQRLTLAPGSLTSVSAISPLDGAPLTIPYGLNLNDVSWIDPRGVDITGGGAPQKSVTLAGVRVDSQAGSVIDVRGGGDLSAYRWVKGVGGSQDILASSQSFAVVPGYAADFAPYAPFNAASPGNSLGGDAGYTNGSLHVGDRIYLGASAGLSAGVYTLLPARYALTSGAFLVTPKSGAPIGTFQLGDGSSLVSGYRLNDLNPGRADDALNARFEVAPARTVRDRAQYVDYSANTFLQRGAQRLGTAVPRLPGDSGHAILQATQALNLAGRLAAQAAGDYRAGLVDIASNGPIVINHGETVAGAVSLNAAQLSSFGAESLLIGGIRTFGSTGTTVSVRSSEVTVDNAGSPLRAPEVILVAKEKLTVAAGSIIEQIGQIHGRADTLFLGNATTPGSGDGLLLRVSSDASARTVRAGVSNSTLPAMIIGDGARLSGASLTLDSTAATSLSSNAILQGDTISLNSGQISVLLDIPGTPPATTGLVLGGTVLDGLRSTQRLSLLSYSSIDFYGTGTFDVAGALALHAAQIRGFQQGGGEVSISSGSLLLDNAAAASPAAGNVTATGTLALHGGAVRLGTGQLNLDQFSSVSLRADSGLVAQGAGGLTVHGNLAITTPFIIATKAATQAITATGALDLLAPASGPAVSPTGGLGATLTLQGASLHAATTIALPSGSLSLRATTGDLVVDGRLDAAGTDQSFYDLTRYTPGGSVTLRADAGAVALGADSIIDVSAAGPGQAGHLTISAPQGTLSLAGSLRGKGGASFALDILSLPKLDTIAPILNQGGFSGTQSFRVRTGDVTIGGSNTAHDFRLSADLGAIAITGLIDASGPRGGHIQLVAGGALTLASGARLTVAGQDFDAAGKGGSIDLETRGLNGGALDLQSGSTIDLSVAAQTSASAAAGKFTGTLHLRAPQNAAGTDLAVSQLASSIIAPSSIVVEGYREYDLTGSGLISTAVQDAVFANGTTFGNGLAASRLLSGNAALEPALVVTAGAEIINHTGNLTLGASNSTATGDWNLATFRFGPKNAAGVLTLRASGNLVFFNALSDGFNSSAYNATLLGDNAALPANAQSWSYRLTAGADFAAADTSRVVPIETLGAGSGSLLLGKNAGTAVPTTPGLDAQTSAIIGNRYQVIRTGGGDITIAAGRDVQFLNQFSTIYTAGTRVSDPTLGGTFDTPQLIPNPSAASGVLGSPQQNPPYPAQFSYAGGNVSLHAQGDIIRYTRSGASLILDSTRELPMNWLYRRGYLDQDTGQFGVAGGPGRGGEIASTAWWIDFSNFFEGVGALGGGNVTMVADRDIANVDAVIPTNARMPKGTPNPAAMVELGGGDLIVRAGRDLDAGVYYVERGHGELTAGGSIKTSANNITRSPSLTNLTNAAPLAPEAWLPTTLFLGKGGFDVGARGDVLLGPTANPFLLPGGFSNTVWYKTYFSTYAPNSFVQVSSLAGSVTLRESSASPGNRAVPILQTWLQDVLAVKNSSASFFQPWLRLNETSTAPFSTVAGLAPGTLRATAFSGDVNIVGKLTLAPSPTGTVELAASGSLNGVQRNGTVSVAGKTLRAWGSATINLSDADPAALPGVSSPFAYQSLVGTVPGLVFQTGTNFLAPVNALFAESGAVRGSDVTLTSKQTLHAPGLLHAGDAEPVRLFAGTGNISGLTLFSGKPARVLAGRDITDIALYVQNVQADDLTVVAAGRDIVAYNANSALRVAAQADGNTLNGGDPALAGDIQLGGPGTLEVLAGRNLDLGIGPSNSDGTGVGIVTIGNARNPALPFDGASIIAAAGIGPASSLATSRLDFESFSSRVLTPQVLAKYLPGLALPGSLTAANFAGLPAERRDQIALEIFFRILRDTGRTAAANGNNYDPGFAAIDALFSKSSAGGDISLTSRAIKTQSGGDLSLVAPAGKLAVGFDATGAQAIDQGLLTEAGGNISIFAQGSVEVGTSRIFTLRGGDITIWSSAGDIAAGAAAKTVQAAPPTRVIVDPQSADVATDLAGLATGGGIGVLATVANVTPGDVDLIAPQGTIDAGDAGIRSAGNLNVAAVQVLNAENIQVTGTSAGTPPPTVVAAPNLGALTAAASTTGATTQAASEVARSTQSPATAAKNADVPSIVTVEVLGYGGSAE